MSATALLQQDFNFIADVLRARALERPRHAALVQGDRSLDYGSLDALMDRIAASLQRDEVRAGEVIAICASGSIEYAAVFLGALRAGVAVAPLAPSSTPAALATMLADSQAKLFFLDETVAASLAGQPPGVERVDIGVR